jgi:hypothetical protein
MRMRRNFRKIPPDILARLREIHKRTIVAGSVLPLSASDIRSRKLAHLGVIFKGGHVEHPKTVLPPPSAGRFSRLNVEGEEIVRKDLPKLHLSHTVETPNWGDRSRGVHEVDLPYEAYRRDFIPPRENEISIKLVGKEAGAEHKYVLRFEVTEVMDRSKRDFAKNLLFNLNLLLENVGAADAFASDADLRDYLKTIYVNWEILPPGEREKNVARILKDLPDSPEIRKRVVDRYEFLEQLKPTAFIRGRGGFRRYFGARFLHDLVVFENMQYGNAVYAMLKNWEQQSKHSRLELLASGREGKDFVRVPHTKGWKRRVKAIIANRIKGPAR